MNIRNLIIFSSIALGLFSSCDRESDIGNYKLKIKSEIADSDSVKVLVYDSDYNQLRTLNAGKLKNGTLTLSGEMQQQTIAMLDYGKKEPITFILEKCETEITIGKDNVISGAANPTTNTFQSAKTFTHSTSSSRKSRTTIAKR